MEPELVETHSSDLNEEEIVVSLSTCEVCDGVIAWIDCPTGGWWKHELHPVDNHDAVEKEDKPCEHYLNCAGNHWTRTSSEYCEHGDYCELEHLF